MLPFRIVESIGVGCGYERSFRLSAEGIDANRYLLGVNTADTTAEQWQQAGDLLRSFPYYTAGYTILAQLTGGLGILTGIGWLLLKKRDTAWLLIVPVLAVILASGLGKYSLIPRMLVWAFPLALLLQGKGWDWCWSLVQKNYLTYGKSPAQYSCARRVTSGMGGNRRNPVVEREPARAGLHSRPVGSQCCGPRFESGLS